MTDIVFTLDRDNATGMESRHVELGTTAIGTEGIVGSSARLAVIHNGEVAGVEFAWEYAAVCAADTLAELVVNLPDEVEAMSAEDLVALAA